MKTLVQLVNLCLVLTLLLGVIGFGSFLYPSVSTNFDKPYSPSYSISESFHITTKVADTTWLGWTSLALSVIFAAMAISIVGMIPTAEERRAKFVRDNSFFLYDGDGNPIP